MKKTILMIFFLTVLKGTSQTNKTFFLGHSLVNLDLPNMVRKLSIAGSKVFTYSVNIANGANLQYHWNNSSTTQGNSWKTTLPLGGFENFILTEAVPLQGHLTWSKTYRFADSLCRYAKLQNPNIQIYIYETWHCTSSGNGSTSGTGGYPCSWDPESTTLWRTRLNNDLPKWQSIADSINLIHTNPMLIIPAGQALAQLYDSIVANKVPGITSINQLYTDNIHLTNTGNYFIACVMYGAIHKTSPAGLPNQLTNPWNSLYTDFPTATQAGIFQRIAWKTLCAYPRDGVNCITTNINESVSAEKIIVSPNPANSTINIQTNETEFSIVILNMLGQKILQEKNETLVDVSELPKGTYFLRYLGKTNFCKKICITD